MDAIMSKQGSVARVYLPPDANTLLAVSEHCFKSQNYINIIIIDKQPQLQYFTLEEARVHAKLGASILRWASNEGPEAEKDSSVEPDVVFASCGDVPTQEALAAVWWLRKKAPQIRVRFVNVLDAMCMYKPDRHPHGLSNEKFYELFGQNCEVIFAFHGYPGGVKMLIHGRGNTDRFHVRGYQENGTTTTPFDMVVLNEMSRCHLAAEALRRLLAGNHKHLDAVLLTELIQDCDSLLKKHFKYVREVFEDLPEIRDWTFTQAAQDSSDGQRK